MVSIKEIDKMDKERIDRRIYWEKKNKERRKETFKELNKTISNVLQGLFIIIKVVLIALISSLAGMKSRVLIYYLNKPLGMGYAHFASYIETAMFAVILFYYFFKENK